jgi:hypothetical protein
MERFSRAAAGLKILARRRLQKPTASAPAQAKRFLERFGLDPLGLGIQR